MCVPFGVWRMSGRRSVSGRALTLRGRGHHHPSSAPWPSVSRLFQFGLDQSAPESLPTDSAPFVSTSSDISAFSFYLFIAHAIFCCCWWTHWKWRPIELSAAILEFWKMRGTSSTEIEPTCNEGLMAYSNRLNNLSSRSLWYANYQSKWLVSWNCITMKFFPTKIVIPCLGVWSAPSNLWIVAVCVPCLNDWIFTTKSESLIWWKLISIELPMISFHSN